MRINTGSFEGMAKEIVTENKKVVIFGLGVVGLTITPAILKKYQLLDRVACCVDSDNSRWGKQVDFEGRKISVFAPEILHRIDAYVTILITASRFWSILDILESFPNSNLFSCYIIPNMCITNFSVNESKRGLNACTSQVIPKKIHYMWFGGRPMPTNLQKCISSWKKFCPEYEIIRWDETNYDVHKNSFVEQAYDNKMYGFVPDYARLELLYEYGGIYLDTDVELVRNLDELLYQEAFCGVEKWQVLNFGGCSGAVKGHASLEPFLDVWSKRKLIRTDGSIDRISSGLIDTSVAIRNGYQINGTNQMVNGMNIYTYDYFHPYDYMSGKTEMTSNTFSIHHFNGGWLDKASIENNQRTVKQYDEFFSNAVVV